MFSVVVDDLSRAQTRALLEMHLRGMHENSPPGTNYALDLSGLQAPEITVWSLWEGDTIVAIGALKMLPDTGGPHRAEIKSMRTHPNFLRRGAAARMLTHILAEARARGVGILSLETGTSTDFDAAVALYTRFGFSVGDVFGDYRPSPHNQFLHLAL